MCLDLSEILPSGLDGNELCKSLVLEHGGVWCRQNTIQVVGLNCYVSKRKEKLRNWGFWFLWVFFCSPRVLCRINGNELRFWAAVLGSRAPTGM